MVEESTRTMGEVNRGEVIGGIIHSQYHSRDIQSTVNLVCIPAFILILSRPAYYRSPALALLLFRPRHNVSSSLFYSKSKLLTIVVTCERIWGLPVAETMGPDSEPIYSQGALEDGEPVSDLLLVHTPNRNTPLSQSFARSMFLKTGAS